ncbi:uncharacterized protein LOC115743588 [Rhodamnia argentea]|uniref:Uncharacterized protein LOC115743588 n=1 Tax=Rhodamnia argentea TaxID=178133 RepID=A0ABM3HPQ9_9MYRT|nr:uncharacterized protein LOC115743588 [Rhodamnia argentea]
MASQKETVIAKWTEPLTQLLVSLMVDEVKKGNRTTSTFNKAGWTNIQRKFNKQTGCQYSMYKFKNRAFKPKKLYGAFKKLLNQTGFGWDNINNGVIVDDETLWEIHVKIKFFISFFLFTLQYRVVSSVDAFRFIGNMEGVIAIASVGENEPSWEDFGDDYYHILMAWLCLGKLHKDMRTREPIRDSAFSGAQWIREIIHGHSDRVCEAFRMERHVFLNLCGLFTARGWLGDSRYLKVDEQVGIFLYLLCHGGSNRDLTERFQCSRQTISWYFNLVLKAVRKLAKEIIAPPLFDVVPLEILMDPKHKPYFKGCVGAIDGTHIGARVPAALQNRFRGRKGTTTQNILCVCSFDMKFAFVYAGWEGFAND